MPTLREFAEANLPIAKKIIAGGKQLTPVLIADTMLAAAPQYGMAVAKEPIREMLSDMLKKSSATRYIFVMESWIGKSTAAEYEAGYLPSKDANRKEAIIMSCANVAGERLVLVTEIKRTEGVVTFGEPFVLPAIGELLELLGKGLAN